MGRLFGLMPSLFASRLLMQSGTDPELAKTPHSSYFPVKTLEALESAPTLPGFWCASMLPLELALPDFIVWTFLSKIQ